MIIVRIPFRLPLGGGGTDLPAFCSKHGATLITASINKFMYVFINKPCVPDKFKLHYSAIETADSVNDIQHGIIRECLKYYNITEPLEISSMADMGAGTGMGSSSAFTAGLIAGLGLLQGMQMSRYKIAEDACHIEIDILGKPIGKQDQYAVTFGGINQLDISKSGRVLVHPVSVPALAEFEARMVMFYTGIQRDANVVLREEHREIEKDDTPLKDIAKIGIGIRESLMTSNIDRFGWLLNEHWLVKRRISRAMTTSNIDKWYDMAMKNGAIGGKLMGAGGGGLLLFCVKDGMRDALINAMSAKGLIHVDFRFDFNGLDAEVL